MKRFFFLVIPIHFLTVAHGQISFSEIPESGLEDARNGSLCLGDVDGDGDLDLLVSGKDPINRRTILYLNDGSGSYSEVPDTPFTGLEFGHAAFVDVDMDNDLDLLITGNDHAPIYYAELYLNDGNGSFSLSEGTPFTPCVEGEFAFSDVDGDNDPDLLMTGYTAEGNGIAELYINDGSGSFTESSGPFEPVASSAVTFFDMDNDGDQDVVIAGLNDMGIAVTNIYANDGSGVFSSWSADLIGLQLVDLDAGDTDGDGDLDLVFTGTTDPYEAVAGIYENDGSGNFSLLAGTPFTGANLGTINLADLDNDGDLDIIQTGNTDVIDTFTSNVYENTGSNIFVAVDSLEDAYLTSTAIGDIDNDGDLDAVILGISNDADNTFGTRIYINELPVVPVTINEQYRQNAFLYPNPASGLLFLTNEAKYAKTVSLYDIAGNLVESMTPQDNTICIFPNLPPGLYLAEIMVDDQVFYQKVVIQ
ncbi:MAG TPA: T9SS type A sorting domain-containing protein [Chitinophagales bacterium]|nr:T9SS type A sorting domain-containing protein [Chitinophagales bacterium]HPE98425.1 T9SS type A sorting domain-containing protein [Chitinophagales bacterium]HRX23666.1 T9SS type A sorting domain-containing protein [Chitinophagales bacterium]